MLTNILLVLFLISAVLVVWENRLLRALIYLSFLSIFVIILTFIYRAPAVTVTAAVVNGAITPMLFLVVMKKIGVLKRGEKNIDEN
ncbi:MAG: hydrogenase subunit MbhD domain-containing protein [Candidatus Thermoplasmatota archaeon]